MFDLDKEVDNWCRSVHSFRFNRKARIEELKDHLYCAVERLQDDGLSDEEAFLHAIGRIGKAKDLAKEHSKNSPSILRAVFRLQEFETEQVDKLSNLMNPKKIAIWLIVISLAFAAAILLASNFVEPENNQTVMYILIAIWFVPYAWLSAAATRKSKDEKEISKG